MVPEWIAGAALATSLVGVYNLVQYLSFALSL